MKIKKIVMRSFGKFQNRTIEFEDGLNLIYGDNEAGKSTIHSFIEGMFYGFYKSNIKNKRHTDAYAAYLPWDNSSEYSGVMVIEDEGRLIRIERNFMRDHDDVKIFDDLSGEDITETYSYDSVTKLYEPAIKHLGLNQNTYNNTVSVGQMSSKTGDELIMEIKNNLMNYGETKTVDVSLTNILRAISDKKAAIGNSRSSKSEFSKTLVKIEELEKEKEDAGHLYEDIKSLQIESNELVGALQGLEGKKLAIEKSMIKFKDSEFEQTYKEALSIQEEMQHIDLKLQGLESFNKVSRDEINDAITKASSIEHLRREYETQLERIAELNQTIDSHKKEIASMEEESVEIGTSEKLIRDVYKYEEFENQKVIILGNRSPENVENAKKDYKVAQKSVRKSKSAFTGLIILFIILALVKVFEYTKTFLTENLTFLDSLGSTFDDVHDLVVQFTWISLGLLGIILILMIIVGIKRKQKVYLCQDLKGKIEREEKELEVANTRVADIDEKQKVILEKHGCEDLVAMQTLKDKKAQEELFYTESFKRAAKLEEDIEVLSMRLNSERERSEKKRIEIAENEQTLQQIMETVGIENYSDFRDVLDKQYEYQRVQQEKASKQDLFNQLTKGESFEHISFDENTADDGEEPSLTNSYEELEAELKGLNDEIIELNKKLSAIETQIANEEASVRPLVEIEDQLGRKKKKLEEMAFKLKSYDILETSLNALTDQSSNSFVPSLNEHISKVIAVATDYKYTEVKVSADMEISIVDNDINKLVKAEDLSAGTIDLMYFALRLGLADLINKDKNTPLLLDDSFVQYDDRRLVKVLELLATIDRQVLLFTCHNRERQLLSRMTDLISIQTM